MKLNLGCGKDIRKGWVNLDFQEGRGVDVVHDLEKFPYPFRSATFDTVLAYQVLEHVDDLNGVMKEIHRILKKGGKLIVEVPHFTSYTSYMDPNHKRLFAYDTFNYYVKDKSKRRTYYTGTEYFSRIERKLHFFKGLYFYNYLVEPLVGMIVKVGNGHLYEANLLRSIFPAWKIHAELIK